MSFFQLDECSNDKRVANRCNAGGKSQVRRWPENLKGVSDHVWFPDVLTRNAPVLTIDFTIVLEEQNRKAIPQNNSGIIVVKPEFPTRGFSMKLATPIIETFKSYYPDWHSTDWSNVYLELNEVSAYVCDFKDESLSNGTRVRYDEEGFVEKLMAATTKAKSTVILGGE